VARVVRVPASPLREAPGVASRTPV